MIEAPATGRRQRL